jgi:hypothetical protein
METQYPAQYFYHGTTIPVLLGDHVEIRWWWRWRAGRVAYFPGQSKPNVECEDGETKAYLIEKDVGFVELVLDASTSFISRTVRFVRRHDDAYQGISQADALQ